MNQLPIEIGKRLRILRTLAGLKRQDLAKISGVSKASISYWEHGKIDNPMKPKSMAKIIGALEKAGIEVSVQWLKDGLGTSPKFQNKPLELAMLFENTPPDKEETKELLSVDITTKLAASFSEEIKLFAALPQAVIMKVEQIDIAPFFEKGDWVGGIWQPSNVLKEEKICIVKMNPDTPLEIYLVKPNQTGSFDLRNIGSTIKKPTSIQLNNTRVEKLAPIIRLWR